MWTKLYTAELSEQILDRVREGKTMLAICREMDLSYSTIAHWKSKNYDKFGDRYFSARQDRALTWSDQIIEIADDCPLMETAIKRAALQIRTRQWLIEKMNPAIFASVTTEQNDGEVEPVTSPVDFLSKWKAAHPTTAEAAKVAAHSAEPTALRPSGSPLG
jgi:hypothetical protein